MRPELLDRWRVLAEQVERTAHIPGEAPVVGLTEVTIDVKAVEWYGEPPRARWWRKIGRGMGRAFRRASGWLGGAGGNSGGER